MRNILSSSRYSGSFAYLKGSDEDRNECDFSAEAASLVHNLPQKRVVETLSTVRERLIEPGAELETVLEGI